MTTRGFLLATTCLIPALGGLAAAQSSLGPGVHVRVRVADGPRLTGTFVGWAADSLELVLDDSPKRIRVAPAMVRRLEISRGRGTGAGKGALIGGALGVVSGVVFALTAPEGEVSQIQLVVLGGAGFGVIGGALGFFFGSFTTIEKWDRAPVPPVGDRSTHTARGWGVGINWRL
jgi:hypothetical protein